MTGRTSGIGKATAVGLAGLGCTVAMVCRDEEGARTSVYLASSPDVEGVTGEYFVKNAPVSSSRESYDELTAKELWELSVKPTNPDRLIS